MDVRWVAILALVAATGCMEGTLTWESVPLEGGDHWTRATSFRAQGSFADHLTGEVEPFDVEGNATARMDVLRVADTALGALELVRAGLVFQDGQSFDDIWAYGAGSQEVLPIGWWRAQSCAAEPVCVPPLAGRLVPEVAIPDEPMLPFPLQVGQSWVRDVGRDAPVMEHGRVIDVATLDVDGEPVEVLRIAFHYTFPDMEALESSWVDDEAPGSSASLEFEISSVESWSTQHGVFVAGHGTARGAVSLTIPDELSFTEVFDEAFSYTTSAIGHGEPAPFADAIAGMDLPSDPPWYTQDAEAEAIQVAIVPFPQRFEVGARWTFVGSAIGAPDEGHLRWSLVESQRDGDRVLATKDGRTFDVTFDLPGAYYVKAIALDEEDRPLGDPRYALVLVDQTILLQGACRTAVSVLVVSEPADVCEGVTFSVPGQVVGIEATATFPREHAVLPCPYLAHYNADGEQFRSFAWTQAGSMSMYTLGFPPEGTAEPSEHEVRWVPSASVEGPVDYEVTIRALGPGSHRGDPGAPC